MAHDAAISRNDSGVPTVGTRTLLRKGIVMPAQSEPAAPAAETSTIKIGDQIIVDTLVELGVDTMFGYTGRRCVAFVRPALRRSDPGHHPAPRAGRLPHGRRLRPRQRQGRRLLATSGPGATNLVTGLATAIMDSIPLVAITGQVRTDLIGNDAFQEADITGITRPITKYNYMVKDIKRPGADVREAFYIATHRPARPRPDRHAGRYSVAKSRGTARPRCDLPGYKTRDQRPRPPDLEGRRGDQ